MSTQLCNMEIRVEHEHRGGDGMQDTGRSKYDVGIALEKTSRKRAHDTVELLGFGLEVQFLAQFSALKKNELPRKCGLLWRNSSSYRKASTRFCPSILKCCIKYFKVILLIACLQKSNYQSRFVATWDKYQLKSSRSTQKLCHLFASHSRPISFVKFTC